MATKKGVTDFLQIKVCSCCDWFGMGLDTHVVCPKCGAKLTYKVGKVHYVETTTWLSSHHEYVSFEPKDTRSKLDE